MSLDRPDPATARGDEGEQIIALLRSSRESFDIASRIPDHAPHKSDHQRSADRSLAEAETRIRGMWALVRTMGDTTGQVAAAVRGESELDDLHMANEVLFLRGLLRFEKHEWQAIRHMIAERADLLERSVTPEQMATVGASVGSEAGRGAGVKAE